MVEVCIMLEDTIDYDDIEPELNKLNFKFKDNLKFINIICGNIDVDNIDNINKIPGVKCVEESPLKYAFSQ